MTNKYPNFNTLRANPSDRTRFQGPLLLSMVVLLGTAGIALGESPPWPGAPGAVVRDAGRDVVALQGSVRSESGEPLVGALVSIFGSSLGNAGMIAFTDEKGRFLIPGLEPGYYTIRAYLSGFFPSHYSRIELDEVGASTAPVSVQMVSSRETEAAISQSRPAIQENPVTANPPDAVEDDDRVAEFKWLLRHEKRNILRERAIGLPDGSDWPEGDPGNDDDSLFVEEVAYETSGELGLFAFERGLHDLPTSPSELEAQLAYARLTIPTGAASEWIVSAQVLESALSSWAARADFVSEPVRGQHTSVGVAYGNHVYGDVNKTSPLLEASYDSPPDRRTNEWFGNVYGAQRFQVGAANIGARLTYHHYSYLDRSDYAAPQLDVAFALDDASNSIVRGLFDYRVLAPGGEDQDLVARMASADFMGSADWGRRGLTAQTAVLYAVSFERHLGHDSLVELRVFQEDVKDPLLKAYLKRPAGDDGPGHYSVTNQGDVRARGIRVAVTRDFGGVAGSLAYRFGVGRALDDDEGAFQRGRNEEIHDLTTAVRTEIDQTRTRVLAVWRLSVHPSLASSLLSQPDMAAAPALTGADPARSLDARFNVQVHQLLPFIGWNSTQWELVLAVRNLFYEDLEAASFIDEISVIDSPARVMGGVKVQF